LSFWGFGGLTYLFTASAKSRQVKLPYMHTSISDKMQQEIISKGGNVFIFYHIALLDISQ
jgi:hypothetical protein